MNAPFSWPKSVLSTSSRGMAATFTGDERAVGLLGVAVDHPRHQLLAGAALAEDEHGGRQVGHLVHAFEHLARGRARARHELAVAALVAHLRGQRQHLAVQVLPFRGVGDDREHRLGSAPT